MRCHRCGMDMVAYVVGWDYCLACTRDLKVREQQDRRFEANRREFRNLYPGARAKELTPVA